VANDCAQDPTRSRAWLDEMLPAQARIEARAPDPRLDALESLCADLGEIPEPEHAVGLRAHTFTPWWGQRLVLRCRKSCRVLVAARQQGKTMLAAFLILQAALEDPGSFNVLLAPTYLHAQAAVDTMLGLTREVPGCVWKRNGKRMTFKNGSVWQVFSADRKESTRGIKVTGLLWGDEAAYLHVLAWGAALGGTTSVKNPQKLLTSTPAGKNWIYDEFVSKDPKNEPFRFRAGDSPYTNMDEVNTNRAKMTPEFAAQEYDAEFVDALILAFPDTSALFAGSFKDRAGDKTPQNTLGIDLGREQDWTVCTLMNRWGEAEILGRWQHISWPETEERILGFIEEHGVGLCCVDKSYVGSYLIDRLEAQGHRVLAFATNVEGNKARMIEAARADVQHERIWVLRGDDSDQLAYELSRFQGMRRVRGGREVVTYECPQLRGEHDDCVISLCLANWGRLHGWEDEEEYDVGQEIKETLFANRVRPRRGDGGAGFGRRPVGGYHFKAPRTFPGGRFA